jgi:hypothetical protein
METPFGGPIATPRHFASPEDGVMRPAMMRRGRLARSGTAEQTDDFAGMNGQIDLSSTCSSSPLPFGKDRQTARISRRLAGWVMIEHEFPCSAEAKATLSEGI